VKIGDTFWLTVFGQIQFVFILIATITFMTVPRMGRKDYLGLGLIIWLSLLIETVTTIGFFVLHKDMNLVVNVYNLLVLPFGIIFYQRRIDGFSRTIATVVAATYILFALINLFFLQGLYVYNSYTSTVSSTGFMCLSVAYFGALIFQSSEHHAVRGMFWINAAILFYSAGTFFIHLLVNYLVTFLKNDLIIVWMVHHSIGLLYYGLISYGLIKVRREYLTNIISI
jgi:hypothetical protein